MVRKKTLIAVALTLIIVVLPVASVYAAPVAQTATVDCTVQSINVSTDSTTGTTSVDITCADGTTASLTTDEALALGLVTQNPDGTFTANDAAIGQVIQVTPTTEDPCAAPASGDTSGGTTTTGNTTSTGETTQTNPVGEALVNFFCHSAGLTPDTLQTYRDQGAGYGVIAQACFMAQLLGDECSAVLDAKLNGDYSGLTLPNGTEVSNWGQLRKAVFGALLGKGEQSSYNLGAIMSGRVQPAEDGTLSPTSVNDHGKGNHGNNGHGHGHGNGHGKP